MTRVFTKVLIANRGEIAVRVIRTLRELGIASVAVYSDADAGARHVREADEAVWIGSARAADSYLHADRILAAARRAGAQAVHPGYGFLSENAAFARGCAAAGLTFIGPPPEAIEAMGDKIAAKATVAAAGVPVVPGAGAAGMPDEELISSLNEKWFPVLIKPSAGGGGKGMRVVSSPAELPDALAAARRTAVAAFGDGTLLVERYVPRPRHIEIQVLADSFGRVIHLGERECSLQRRHQKIIEEAPSPLLTAAQRAVMGSAAIAAAASVGYAGAGTVEFIVAGDAPDDFFFMEMNTRLQVEHPVTELVYGLDLVEWQLRVAAGESLPFTVGGLPINGHAVEARVYAEDPSRGFLPTGGVVLQTRSPSGAGVRVDSALLSGETVTSDYDPMLAKVAAWGPDRPTALRRLDAALAGTVVLGVTTNVSFLRALLADPGVQAGRLDTGLAEQIADAAYPPGSASRPPDEVLAAAALARLLERARNGRAGPAEAAGPWDIPDGWRVGGPAWTKFRFSADPAHATPTEVRARGLASAGAEVAVDGRDPGPARAEFSPPIPPGGPDASGPGPDLLVTVGQRTLRFAYATSGTTTWLGRDGQAWSLHEEDPAPTRENQADSADDIVRSPMPGTVVSVSVAEGQAVRPGQPLLVVEAMKMEHTVTAQRAGVLTALTARAGQQVTLDEPLAVIESRGLTDDAQDQEPGRA